ncbi:MAG: SCO family protein, partial [Pseudomonadales bacterium]
MQSNSGPPLIEGVVIPTPQATQQFSLVNHHNEKFNNTDLQGNWHIVAYGYTDCPDICPTTLAVLAQVEKQILSNSQYTDLRVLFYTVDPQRDTVEKLSSYVPFFSSNFIGLTPKKEQNGHTAFERSLGIRAVLTPLPEAEKDYKGYSVSHGVMLYVLNSQGQLQAVLKPEISSDGTQFFTAEKIYRDYTALRDYFG